MGGTKRYIDADKLIEELNQVYKGCMTEICIMPLGMENWLNERAVPRTESRLEYPPTEETLEQWDKDMNELHRRDDLDSVIKELTVICCEYERRKMDHLQTECYRKALRYLLLLRNGGGSSV